MKQKKRWEDLTPSQRAAIVVAGAVEVVVTAAALVDIARRPKRLVRGPKRWWLMGFAVQPFGPIAYLAFGRR
ncbi:MAG TPA: PLDc N-terminal domain-containing protein [Ilumatobacter sp.]|nr:PLDc N-terminal domain-containing protein [Ilumatobacter sp.]